MRGGGGGSTRGQDPPLWGTPKLHKEGKTSRASVRMHPLSLGQCRL